MTGYIEQREQDELMDVAVVEGDVVLASGRLAHQKFEFDHIQNDPRLRAIAATGLARCIQNEFDKPDAIATVARGATGLGDEIVSKIEGRHIKTDYHQTKEGKQFYLVDDVEPGEKVIVVDDVYTSGTNSGKVIDLLLARGAMLLGVAVLLNRSENENPLSREVPVRYVMHKVLN